MSDDPDERFNNSLDIPPVNPSDPETRLLRAIFGVCPDCDHDRNSHHDGNDDGQTHHCREC